MARKKLATIVTAADPTVTNNVSRIPLNIASVIIDRLAGASIVDALWSEKVNTDYLVHVMSQDKTLRDKVAQHLMDGSMGKAYENFIGVATQRAGGVKGTKSSSFDSIVAIVNDTAVATVLNECVIPIYMANGLVSGHSSYGVRRKVPYAEVTVQMLADDLLKQEIVTAVKQATERFVVPAGTSSTRALSEMLADAMRPIGIALTMVSKYEDVISDIVLGVLANIDPAPLATQMGSIPHELRLNSIVQQLSTCWNFIHAALVLRSEINGANGPSLSNASPKVNAALFEKYADVVMAMIRSSERYAMVSRSHFVGDIGFKKIFNLKGIPVSTVVYHAASLEAMAMAVVKVDDISLAGAINLQAAPDRVSERMAAAYGDIERAATTERAAQVLADVLTLAVESNTPVDECIIARLATQNDSLSEQIIAVMSCENVSASYEVSGGTESQVKSGYKLMFSGRTNYQGLELKSGRVVGGSYYTTSPSEAFLCMEELNHSRVVDAPPQAIPYKSLNTKLLGFDKSADFISATSRGTYATNVEGIELNGTIRLHELTSIRMGSFVHMVTPYHNSEVYNLIEEMVEKSFDIAKSIKNSDAAMRRAKRTVAQFALEMAQSISPSYRGEVHAIVVEGAVAKLTQEESVAMRAKLNQQSLSAAVDIISLSVLVKLQGLGTAKIFDSLGTDEEIVDCWIDYGSDRKK